MSGTTVDPGVPMSGSEWTVGEAAAHLVFGVEDYSEHAWGAEQCYLIDPTDRARSHRRYLAAMAQRDSQQLGAELQLGMSAFLGATEGRAAEDLLPWHQRSLPCVTMTCLLIGEQLLHGYDMAQTLGVEWSIKAEAARLTVQAVLPLLPASVDSEAAKEVDATYELTVRGSPRVIARFRDGTGEHRPARERARRLPPLGGSGCLAAGPVRQGRLGGTPADGPGDGDAALGAGSSGCSATRSGGHGHREGVGVRTAVVLV